MFAEYNNIVIDHFMTPRNSGIIENYNAEGSYGDPECGDSLNVYLKVENDIIIDISFLVFGCVAAIATSSMITELAKGLTLKEALLLQKEDVTTALGGLPENKVHCSLIGITALQNAIENYYSKK